MLAGFAGFVLSFALSCSFLTYFGGTENRKATTNLVFDLKATDTYAQTGDKVFIEGDPFVLEPNLAICAATNARGVRFRVAGGTGGHAGATGQGRFDIYSNLTSCNGLTVAAHVSFEGLIKVPN